MAFNIPSLNRLYCMENANFGQGQTITFEIPVIDNYDMITGSYAMVPLQINTTSLAVPVGTPLPQGSIYNVGLQGKERRLVPSTVFVKQVQFFVGGQQQFSMVNLDVLNQNLELYKYNINQAKTQERLSGFFVDIEDKNQTGLRSSGFRILSSSDTSSNEQLVYARIPMKSLIQGIASRATDLKKMGNTCMIKMLIGNYSNEIEVGEVQNDTGSVAVQDTQAWGLTVNCDDATVLNQNEIVIPIANLQTTVGGVQHPLLQDPDNPRLPFKAGDILSLNIEGAGFANAPFAIADDYPAVNGGNVIIQFAGNLACAVGDTIVLGPASTPSATTNFFVPCATVDDYVSFVRKFPPNSNAVLLDANLAPIAVGGGVNNASAILTNDVPSFLVASDTNLRGPMNWAYSAGLGGMYVSITTALGGAPPANFFMRNSVKLGDIAVGANSTTLTAPPVLNFNQIVNNTPNSISYNSLTLLGFKIQDGANLVSYKYYETLPVWENQPITITGQAVPGPVNLVANTITSIRKIDTDSNGNWVLTFNGIITVQGASNAPVLPQIDNGTYVNNLTLNYAWTPSRLLAWNSQPVSLFGNVAGAVYSNKGNVLIDSISYATRDVNNNPINQTITFQSAFNAGVNTNVMIKQWPSATKTLVLPQKWQLVLTTTAQKDDRDGYYQWVEMPQYYPSIPANASLNATWNPIDERCKGVMVCFPPNNKLLTNTETFQNYQLMLNGDPLMNRPVDIDPSGNTSALQDRLIKGFASMGIDVKCLNSDPQINPLSSDIKNNNLVQSISFAGGEKNYIQLQMQNGGTQVDSRNLILYQFTQKMFSKK